MNIAVILAGGIGKRLGAGKPKQFVELCGKPMILYSMEIVMVFFTCLFILVSQIVD